MEVCVAGYRRLLVLIDGEPFMLLQPETICDYVRAIFCVWCV